MADEPGFELVVPFVCCQSQGGRYDDESFVAGARMEQIRWELKKEPDELQTYTYPALCGQLDLIAMDAGYTVEFEPWEDHPDEWTLATFTRVGGQ
jgi:hypothetical protein